MGKDGVPDLPALPRDEAGAPVFQAPWEAQAFAMAVRSHEASHFTWTEWAEELVAEKGLVGTDELHRRKDEWDAAARSTPHGQPIELHRGRSAGS